MSYPNQIYTVFSFTGFVLCTIPFYWHFKGTWIYSRSFENPVLTLYAPSSEYGHLLVHDLGGSRMPDAMHQLDRMEREHDQQGSSLL